MRMSPNPNTDGNFLNQVTDQVGRAVIKGSQNAQRTASGIMGSLQRAANATGVDFGYLIKTAQRESALNPNAHAQTSSAAGLFQFVEQTWLGMLKVNGGKHGYGAYADQITKGRDGRYVVANPDARKQVLGLRYNPDANAVMAAEMTAGHAAYLKGRIGRAPTQGELYAAHFLGPDGAADLIQAGQRNPQAVASGMFPKAAQANHSIFYGGGRALNVSEVLANLTRTGGSAPVDVPDAGPDTENPLIQTRLDKIKTDQAIMQLVFGDGDQKGLLFTTQLMSAFGPNGMDGDKDKSNNDMSTVLSQVFGSDETPFG